MIAARLRRSGLPLLGGLAFAAGLQAQPAPQEPAAAGVGARLRADVEYLASERLRGRAAGSAGGDSAAAFVALRFDSLGLAGPFGRCPPAQPACGGGHVQAFEWGAGTAHNLAGWVAGADSAARGRYLLVGAHIDHLGSDPGHSADPFRGHRPRRGADDNASGIAVLLELARRFAERPAPVPILFVAFDAEEEGMIGSRHFIRAPPAPLDSAVLMLNLDMVGRLRGRRLYFDLGAPGPQRRVLRAALDSLAERGALRLASTSLIVGRSDHAPFRERGVPALALFTGFHADYHTTRDLPERVNYAGLEAIADLAEGVLRAAATAAP